MIGEVRPSVPLIIPSMASKPEKMSRIIEIWNCINAIGLNKPSNDYTWQRLERIQGAPMQVKIVWLGMVRDSNSFAIDLCLLWESMSDRQKEKHFPVIKRWIIEEFQNPKSKWEYLKNYSTIMKDFLERGILDGCDDDTKAIVLNRILCKATCIGDLDTILKISSRL